ncbi:MAG TPA: ATP-binding protein, partial [Albitalea sp.]|nr:ATP-binding protein [Albitalea sp.]
NKIGRWFLLNALSLAHEALKDRPAAWASAQQAYELAQIIGLPVYRTEADQRLGALAAASGNYKLAYEYTLDAARLQARAASEKASSHIVELAQRYENESRQRAFEELTQRNQLQTSELRQRELRNLYLSALLGLSLAALAGSAFFVIRLRRSDNAVRALNATLEQRVEASTAELRQTQGYLRVLLDTLPLWAWFKDTGGRYLAVNRATAAACGLAVPDMVGRRDDGLSPPSMGPILQADDREVLARRERHTFEAALPDHGQPVWMEVYKAPVLADDGTLLGIVGVARDVSERKAAEAAREAALAEAERLARQRSGFLAQMSHELRTPLNGILGFVQILQREKSLTERQVRGLKVIGESGQHLLTLINDILDLARIDAGRLEFCPSEFQLAGFLDVVSDIARVKAEEKGLLYVLQADATLPAAVRADEKRLRQVLLNLLSNAVKFTDKGMVSLTVSAKPGRAGHSRLRFDVRDSGIGMTPAQQSRLFQPFEQVGEAKRREGGTGLGLAISQQLVRLMGGDIRVESEAGQGSHFGFEVELPVVAPSTAPHAHGVPVGYVGPRKRVLIADDSASNRAVLVEALRQLDFEVDEAADGAQAVLRALLGHPDLVIMDIVMPVMDGIDATRAVRDSAGLSHIPVIACSGSADDGMRAACRAAGANGFLSKPVDLDELLELIRQCLRLEWRWEARQPAVAARP